MQGSSMPDMGVFNEKVVLQTVRRAPDGISQAEIAEASGLSRQAVSQIVRRLKDAGVLEVSGTAALARGKPRTLLRVVPSARHAGGIHVDPTGIAIVIADINGDVVARRDLGPPSGDAGQGGAHDLARIVDALEDLVSEAKLDAVSQLTGVGVAAPGGLDADRGLIDEPPWLPGWRHLAVTDALAAATGVDCRLEKDTLAALTAETWVSGRGGTVLYVYVGAGVGSALAVDGAVVRGASALAGEIGHLPTGLGDERCECGRIGCLGLLTDLDAVLRAARVRTRGAETLLDGARRLGSMAADGKERARASITTYGEALGAALRTLIGIHDPSTVILGGPVWGVLSPHLEDLVRDRALDGAHPSGRARIVSSQLGDDVGARGAACLMLDGALTPHRWGTAASGRPSLPRRGECP